MTTGPEAVMIQILLALGVLLLVVLIFGAVQLVGILRKFLRTADSVSRMADTTERELSPALQGLSRSTLSISQLLARFDKLAAILLGRFEILGEGAEKVKEQATRFMESPLAELQSWMAGLRRGIDVFLASKERNGGGDKNG